MSHSPTTSKGLAALFLLLVGIASSLGFGSFSTAVEKVREGLDHFTRGQFEAAGKAFAEADVAKPENAMIAFDRACALAALGEMSKAKELYQQAAMARDLELAARSHYNLGCLAAGQGQTSLGDDPVTASPDQRQQGLSLLLEAVGHYRDCLKQDANHANARHNLELIRLFIQHMQAQWEQLDRNKSREEMGLLEFLATIEQRQVALRRMVRTLREETDSPQRRQATRETATGQAALEEEIEPLKEKIAAQFQTATQTQAGSGDPNQEPVNSDQREEAQKLLKQLADEAGNLMASATSTIEAGDFGDAETRQRDVLDRLNQIFMALAPFANVLQRATREQEQLTSTSEALSGVDASTEDLDHAGATQTAEDRQPANRATDDATSTADFPQLQWQQSRVSDWSRMLSLKAKSELPQVEAQLETAKSQPTEEDHSAALPDSTADPSAPLEALKKSLQKALELGPKVEAHAAAATASLGATDLLKALPEQQQAQKLLREIAEPLARENQQAGDQNHDKQDQNSQQQQQQQPDQPSQQQTGQSPRERAQATLRRARQRERQHRDLQQQLQQMIGGRVRVDRDW